jgi:uncharacterized phiE125 gp8 family phage protein
MAGQVISVTAPSPFLLSLLDGVHAEAVPTDDTERAVEPGRCDRSRCGERAVVPEREIGCAWTLVTGPTSEPVSLDDVKHQARILGEDSNAVLANYIATAREAAESYMGRGILTQTWKLVLDCFVNVMPLPMAAPLQNNSLASPSTAVVVQYYDEDGAQQTLATSVYDVDTVSRPGCVVLKPDQEWPSIQSDRRNGAVTITYVVGWTSADLVPERIKHGIRQYVTYLDLDRDGLESRALDALQAAERCWTDRIWWTAPRWRTY